jgi:predicted AlkP superfamily phosphohydrolase/phosphomutase
MHTRALLIGLDCAAPQLVLDRWVDELPTLQSLMARGSYGVLRSCDPPITVPAWSCMAASRSPGSLGIYGFRNRSDHSYDGLRIADSHAVSAPRLWDLLSATGRPVIVLGVPGTYPPNPVEGVMVSCFLTPDVDRHEYTYPSNLGREIAGLVGRYMVDVDEYRTDDKGRLLAQLHEMTAKRFRVAEYLLESRAWDLFFMVEIGTDRIHHGFWRYTDELHRFHDPDSPWSGAIRDYYRDLDARLGRLLRFADDDTLILVVSDHGAQPSDGGVCINEWLRCNGYLTLKREPAQPAPLDPSLVDWERTVAWGEGGYYCRLFMNVEGREPSGVVPAVEYESVRAALKAGLETIGDEWGRPNGTVAHRPEDLYPACNGIPPDLLVYFGGLRWRSIGRVGTGALHLLHNDTGPDDANHAFEGLYIIVGHGVPPGRGPDRSLLDVAPTILTALGEPVPSGMEGRSWIAGPATA